MKVLGFDNWTGGSRHFERLVAAFADAGCTLTLVHLGSWGNDRGRSTEEMIGALPVRDIAFYGDMGFADILVREQPDAVLLFSTRSFAHRAFLRYCRAMAIPTVHAYHGLVRVQAVDGPGRPYQINWRSYLRFAVSRIHKSITLTWPVYARALWDTSASPGEWWRFLIDIWDFSIGHVDKPAADDARTTKCCVYTAADVQHAITHYGFSAAEIVPVGNPDLMAFGVTESMLGRAMSDGSDAATGVMYLDTALVATGLVFDSDAAYVDHLLAVRDALAVQGLRLLFKPHPDMRLRGIDSVLDRHGVEIVENADFIAKLSGCRACIVETTTVAMIPALLGMPLLLATFGKLESLRFGEVLRSYPRARALERIDQVARLLSEEQEAFDRASVDAWMSANAGPLPAADMPSRVATIVRSLVLARAGASPKPATLARPVAVETP